MIGRVLCVLSVCRSRLKLPPPRLPSLDTLFRVVCRENRRGGKLLFSFCNILFCVVERVRVGTGLLGIYINSCLLHTRGLVLSDNNVSTLKIDYVLLFRQTMVLSCTWLKEKRIVFFFCNLEKRIVGITLYS